MTTYYKFLRSDHKGKYSNFDYSAYLPKGSRPGKWLPKIKEIEPCESGYHVCLKKDLSEWANDDLYIVEIRGRKIKSDTKIVAQEMRIVSQVKGWNEKNCRLAAVEIVRKISLPVWKKYYPDDKVIEDCIDTVERFAYGKATDADLSAARSAAESAAWSAARSAAESAAWSAAWSAARSAARSAAESAAESAARSAAESAARSAARKIIYKHCGL